MTREIVEGAPKVSWRTFYLATNINRPGTPLGGVLTAERMAEALERVTGARCTSRWIWATHHHRVEGSGPMGTILASTDLIDIARADFVVIVPLTPTSRGAHVELGAALALDKPTFLYSHKDRDPTAFDSLAVPVPPAWREAIESAINGGA